MRVVDIILIKDDTANILHYSKLIEVVLHRGRGWGQKVGALSTATTRRLERIPCQNSEPGGVFFEIMKFSQ